MLANPFYRAWAADLTLTGSAHCTWCARLQYIWYGWGSCACAVLWIFTSTTNWMDPKHLGFTVHVRPSVQHMYHRSSDALRVWHCMHYSFWWCISVWEEFRTQSWDTWKSGFSLGSSRKNSSIGRRWLLVLHSPDLFSKLCLTVSTLSCCTDFKQIWEGTGFQFGGVSCVLAGTHFLYQWEFKPELKRDGLQLGAERTIWPRVCVIHFQCHMAMLNFVSHLQITSKC